LARAPLEQMGASASIDFRHVRLNFISTRAFAFQPEVLHNARLRLCPAANAERRAADADRRVADADRRAAEADRRAADADEKMEEMKRLARTTPGGADAATLHGWQAEADAAAAGSPSKGRGAGAAPDASNPKSPTKRRREKSPEVDNFVDAEEEQAVEEEGVETRAAAELMTVQQLKHELQVRGLAHLYLNKKVKKADLVEMFLAP